MSPSATKEGRGQPRRSGANRGGATRVIIVKAAIATLKAEGFARASARSIARRGKFNQALIFYHFGSVDDLLLAALDATAEERMKRYRSVLSRQDGFSGKLEAAAKLYREDLESGHITVLTEMIAGSLSRPELAPQIERRMDPWIDLAEKVLMETLEGTPLQPLLPTRTLALAVVALYLGVDLLHHLSKQPFHVGDLFGTAAAVVPIALEAMAGSSG